MADGRFKILVEDRFGTVTDEYEFDAGKFILGRSSNCDIVLPGDNVSRRHARLFTKDDALFIEDLNSANGTFVNGKKITKPVMLLDGTVFRVGDFHIHVHGGVQSLEPDTVFLRLIGLNRSVKDEIFEVKEKTSLVGRGNDCQIVIVDPSISRVHARFLVMNPSTVLVKDMGSANGVYVNGRMVNTWELRSGDDLRIGDLEFKVEIPGADTTKTKSGWIIPGKIQTPSARSRMLLAVSGILAIILVLLVFYVVRTLSKQSSSGQVQPRIVKHGQIAHNKQPSVKVVPAHKIRDVDISALLAQAKEFLKHGDLDAAESLLAKADKLSPGDPKVITLKNQVELEKENRKLLIAAQKSMSQKKVMDAAGLLLRIPETSIFHKSAGIMLEDAKDNLALLQNRVCRTSRSKRGVRCRQIHALISRIDSKIAH